MPPSWPSMPACTSAAPLHRSRPGGPQPAPTSTKNLPSHLPAVPQSPVMRAGRWHQLTNTGQGVCYIRSRDRRQAQKDPKAFLLPEPAGTTRSTLNRTVLDSGLRIAKNNRAASLDTAAGNHSSKRWHQQQSTTNSRSRSRQLQPAPAMAYDNYTVQKPQQPGQITSPHAMRAAHLHCPMVTVSPSWARKAGEMCAAMLVWRFSYLHRHGPVVQDVRCPARPPASLGSTTLVRCPRP